VAASPLFPPQYQNNEEAKTAILHVVRRDPTILGIDQTRWTLDAIRSACDWLDGISISGLCHLLSRLGISWKSSREHVHSPDPNYTGKVTFIDDLYQRVLASDDLALLFLDELSYYRQPSLAHAYEERGSTQSLAERSHKSNTRTRIAATLDAVDGRVIYEQKSIIGVDQLVSLYQRVCQEYSDKSTIYIVQDNWPVHFHPDVLVALETQVSRWPLYRPSNWTTDPSPRAIRRYGSLNLPIQLIPLPTYASWLNPIEKLWRKLKQEFLHLHRLADNLEALRNGVCNFLEQYAYASLELLRYVGLLVPD